MMAVMMWVKATMMVMMNPTIIKRSKFLFDLIDLRALYESLISMCYVGIIFHATISKIDNDVPNCVAGVTLSVTDSDKSFAGACCMTKIRIQTMFIL
jgi:hypothetical protein